MKTLASYFQIICCITLFHATNIYCFSADDNTKNIIAKFQQGSITEKEVKMTIQNALNATTSGDEQIKIISETLGNLSKDMPRTYNLVIDYSILGLAKGISSDEAAQYNIYLGNAFEEKSQNAEKTNKNEFLLRALQYYLHSFQIISDSLKQDEYVPPPSVSEFDYSGSHADLRYLKLIRQHDEEIAKRKYIDQQNNLLDLKQIVVLRTHELSKQLDLSPLDQENLVKKMSLTPLENEKILSIMSH